MITKYNISKPNKYMKDGVEKTFWQNVGILTEFSKENGNISRLIEIPAIGLVAQAFKIETKVQTKPIVQQKKEQGPVQTDVEYPDEKIDPNSIPF